MTALNLVALTKGLFARYDHTLIGSRKLKAASAVNSRRGNAIWCMTCILSQDVGPPRSVHAQAVPSLVFS